MKSTVFEIKPLNDITDKIYAPDGTLIYKIYVPTLDAYAIEYVTFHLSGSTAFLGSSCIKNSELEIYTKSSLAPFECRCIVHYHGIRDYALLFPNVTQPVLKERLGKFYQEAESSFENSAWLTFMLMCGAIFEGILFSKIGENKTFEKLIEKASETKLIDDDAKLIMHNVRSYRNIVHANRINEPYVTRADAMDTRRLLEAIIKLG